MSLLRALRERFKPASTPKTTCRSTSRGQKAGDPVFVAGPPRPPRTGSLDGRPELKALRGPNGLPQNVCCAGQKLRWPATIQFAKGTGDAAERIVSGPILFGLENTIKVQRKRARWRLLDDTLLKTKQDAEADLKQTDLPRSSALQAVVQRRSVGRASKQQLAVEQRRWLPYVFLENGQRA